MFIITSIIIFSRIENPAGKGGAVRWLEQIMARLDLAGLPNLGLGFLSLLFECLREYFPINQPNTANLERAWNFTGIKPLINPF